jgi:hypothetical protein
MIVAHGNHHRDENAERESFAGRYLRAETKEANMPLLLLWVGIPVLLVGGGYFVLHTMH